eukprot:6195066-Pleurochrysis_carterae.AAC.3
MPSREQMTNIQKLEFEHKRVHQSARIGPCRHKLHEHALNRFYVDKQARAFPRKCALDPNIALSAASEFIDQPHACLHQECIQQRRCDAYELPGMRYGEHSNREMIMGCVADMSCMHPSQLPHIHPPALTQARLKRERDRPSSLPPQRRKRGRPSGPGTASPGPAARSCAARWGPC